MKYVIYCRKSSEDEGRQILSIPAQLQELQDFAAHRGLEIAEIFTESQSAKAPGRPVFNKMIERIGKGKIQGIICWKLDRLSRNPIDGGNLIWAIKQNNLEIITPAQSFRRDDENAILMYLEFGMAQKYIDDLSKNVKRGNKAKLESGGWPNMAPFGYKNNKADRSIEIDHLRSPYLVQMFEMYATGSYSVKDIARILYDKGLRPVRGARVSKARIHMILKNPFYYGMMVKDGKHYPGKHEPLISKALFDRVQDVFSGRILTKKQKHFFHLRGFFTCAGCGCALTANKKKGHDYYYCTNGKGNCEEHKKYIRSEKLDMLVVKTLRKLQIRPNLIEVMYKAAKEKELGAPEQREASRESLKNQLVGLQEKQSRLADSFIEGITPEPVYRQKMATLKNQQVDLERQLNELGNSAGQQIDTLELARQVFLSSNGLEKEFSISNDVEKRQILEKVLWNLSIENQKVKQHQFKMPYQIIANLPKNASFSELCAGWDDVRTFLMKGTIFSTHFSLEKYQN